MVPFDGLDKREGLDIRRRWDKWHVFALAKLPCLQGILATHNSLSHLHFSWHDWVVLSQLDDFSPSRLCEVTVGYQCYHIRMTIEDTRALLFNRATLPTFAPTRRHVSITPRLQPLRKPSTPTQRPDTQLTSLVDFDDLVRVHIPNASVLLHAIRTSSHRHLVHSKPA
jgi:hypothetical protein